MSPHVKAILFGVAGALIVDCFRTAGPVQADGSHGNAPWKATLPLVGQMPTLFAPAAK